MCWGRKLRPFSSNERIARLEGREAGEVPVGRPQFADPMLQADGGDPGVMKLPAANAAACGHVAESGHTIEAFIEQECVTAAQPGLD